MSRARTPADAGYTVLEMVVTIALAGTLMAIAVSGWQGWARAAEQDGFATELQLVLRQAQQRAVTTGSSICVDFDADADSWTVLRGRCDGPTTVLESTRTAPAGLDLTAPAFTYDAEGTELDGVTFRPWGSATRGGLEVRREDGPTLRIDVQGLTGRVSVD